MKQTRVPIPYVKEPATVFTDDNGYQVILVPKAGDVFNISTWVKTGSIHEDDRVNGVSHFLEHLLFKGTERFKPGEFDRKMESMGAIINAATWKDFTFYYITGPKDKANENFDLALDMHADMMIHSTIPETEVGPPYDPAAEYTGEKRERSVVIEEIGMREDQPWTKIYNSVNHMMYPVGHPYQRDVIGTRKIIGLIPRQDIIEYYRKWYSPQNLVTIVVGDFTPEEIEKKVFGHFDFSKLPKAEPGKAVTSAPKPEPNGKNRAAEVPGEYQTCFFMFAYHGPDPKNLRETIALDIASHALGEGRSSRMNQELVEKPATPVFNFVSCGQSTYKLGNAFYVQGNFNTPEGHSHQHILKEVEAQIALLLNEKPVTQAEFDRALKKLKVQFAETSETVSGIAESIGESITIVGDMSHYTEYMNELKSLDLATVNAVAKKYLGPENMYQSILVPSTESVESLN